MKEYITELSKYGITACMLIYTISSYVCFIPVKEKRKENIGLYIFQCVFLFMTQLLCFANLTVASGNYEYIFLYVFVQIFLLAIIAMVPLIYETVNRFLLNNMCMLLGTGLCIISRLSFKKSVKQYIIALASLTISLMIPYFLSRVHFLKKLTWVYGLVGFGVLSTVLLLGDRKSVV